MVVLLEHQSTINPNMALRLLMYIARVYEKMLGDKNIYTTKALRIPRPEFFVLYNGLAPYPDEQVLRLSDAFENTASLGISEKGPAELELTVRVININKGRNEGLVQRSRILQGYSAFIGKVREYERKTGDREAALKQAVTYCCELEQHASEVMNMLTTEWNWDDAKKVWYNEGREEGLEKGREEIAKAALAKGMSPVAVGEITGLDIETVKRLAGQ
ncbi:MAG: Rpn family recombination-promoting nuclease/putative transposase [Treponema sp.]|nr:Rpn family recombination-promoting nuclease/putative transposase [Treponema sp.]